MQVIGPGGLPMSAQSCVLSPSQPLDISLAEGHLLDSFRASLEAWGWRWELAPADGAKLGAARLGAAAAAGPADGAWLTHAAMVLGTPLNGVELQVLSASVNQEPSLPVHADFDRS